MKNLENITKEENSALPISAPNAMNEPLYQEREILCMLYRRANVAYGVMASLTAASLGMIVYSIFKDNYVLTGLEVISSGFFGHITYQIRRERKDFSTKLKRVNARLYENV